MQVVSVDVHYFSQYYLVAMATALDKSDNEVQVDHLHPKRFHTVEDCGNRSSTSKDI